MASVTTKAKLQFVHAMARHTRATVRQCEALMRYAATLQRLAEDDCNIAADETGQQKRDRKKLRIANRVLALCQDIKGSPIKHQLAEDDAPVCRFCGLEWLPGHECTEVEDAPCVPLFQNDPRGAVLKIRVPDGFTDDWGREGICVPS